MTHYERLGITRAASREEIKRAFRARAMRTHPDLHHGSPEEIRRASREFSDLSNAYRGLIDPIKRAAYDRALDGDADAGGAGAPAAAHPEPGQPVRMEDYDELDALRVAIWNEPRNEFIRQTLLYSFFLVLLLPLYSLLIRNLLIRWNAGQSVWRSFVGTLTVPLIGLWATWVISLRLQRIRACGGFRRFWRRTRNRRRRPRRGTSMEWGSLPLVLLALMFADAMLIYASDALGVGVQRGLVMAVAPMAVLGWIGWRNRQRRNGRSQR